MSGGLDDRVIVVTGGANGLGRAYCQRLFADGARLVVADLDGEGAHALAAELDGGNGGKGSGDGEPAGPRAIGVRVDVTSPTDTVEMINQAEKAFGRVDVLLNNAGSYPHQSFDDIDYDTWRRVVTMNLDSVFLCTKAVLPVMRRQGGGAIINVVTNLVWSGLANMSHYIAAKNGVVGLTKSLARELGDDSITVNALAPGAVIPNRRLTPSGQDAVDQIVRYQAVKRPQAASDLVGAVRFLCSDDAAFMSGQVLTVDGGLTMH